MERSELISKLCKEAAETTPDIYDKIIKTAKSQGLINAGGVAAGLPGESATAAKGAGGRAAKSVAVNAPQSRIAAIVATLLAAFIAITAVAVPLALNVKSGIGDGSQIEAPDGSGGSESEGGGSSGTPETPDAPDTPEVPEPPVNPVEPGIETNADKLKFEIIDWSWTALAVIGFESYDSPLDVVIPSKYNGREVVAIADNAFGPETKVSTVYIPASVTNIRSGAFKSCETLKKVVSYNKSFEFDGTSVSMREPVGMSDTPYAIEKNAFSQCDNLESIEFFDCEMPEYGWELGWSEAIHEIHESAFYNCPNLQEIRLPNSIREGYTNENKEYYHMVFDQCDNLTTINVPAGLGKLPNGFLGNSPNLENLIIPEGIKEIQGSTLRRTVIKELNIPASVIYVYSLGELTHLVKITVAADSKRYMVVNNCLVERSEIYTMGTTYVRTDYTLAIVPKNGTVPDNGLLTGIDGYAFNGMVSSESIAVPDGVKRLEHYALTGIEGLKEVTLPSSLTYIGAYLFGYYPKLERIEFEGTVEQWKKISVDDRWYNGKAYSVVCSNGTVNG